MAENKQITSQTEGVEIRAQSNAHNQGRLNRLPAAAPASSNTGAGSSGSSGGSATSTTTPAGSDSSKD